MKFVKSKEWLFNHLKEDHVRIVDCRFSLAAPEKGKQDYLMGHIPSAVFFDLEQDLSGPVKKHGGRHPLPDMTEFLKKLQIAGINENTVVIAYDYGEGAFAARFWWLLQYLGHRSVFVLDGGYQGWQEGDYPVTTDIPSFEETVFEVKLNTDILTTIAEVQEVVNLGKKDTILIDSREEKRFQGIEEPIDRKAGHIPGAINKPWMEGLQDSKYKSVEHQQQRFGDLLPESEIIVYCGSGVTAAPNFLALKEAGFQKVKLYVGSFSDWISYEENKIE